MCHQEDGTNDVTFKFIVDVLVSNYSCVLSVAIEGVNV